MGTKALIVCSARTKVPRRIIHPDDDAEIADPTQHARGGEVVHVVDKRHARADTIRSVVASLHGVAESAIPSGRCAVVDPTGVVVHVIMADPTLDAHAAGSLIESDSAEIGDRWDGTKFVRP
jgi:hypothetical protein